MNKTVDKLWVNLWESVWENCGKILRGWWKNVESDENCEKMSGFTHYDCSYTLRFTQVFNLCFYSRIYTVSTGLIITIINNLINKEYNNVRRYI